MMKNGNRKRVITAVLGMVVAAGILALNPAGVTAAEKFDPAFYAAAYPDVAAALGTDGNVLYNHYVTYGKAEGRVPYAGAAGGAEVDGIAGTTAQAAPAAASTPGIVPLQNLPHYDDIKYTMTDAEFVEVYNALLPLAQISLLDTTPYERAYYMTYTFGIMCMSDQIEYSDATPHCNDPYGYFFDGIVDSGGTTRAMGLYFDMVGIEWEHVTLYYTPTKKYEWCVVTIDGQKYIADPFMCIFTPETSRHYHPIMEYLWGI